jgi:hypothetical protein
MNQPYIACQHTQKQRQLARAPAKAAAAPTSDDEAILASQPPASVLAVSVAAIAAAHLSACLQQ